MSNQDTSEFLIIGHRGCMGLEPENTMRGFRKALELGVPMIETDLHLVDGELILIHDVDLSRTTNGTGQLSDVSLDDLRQLDTGKGEPVPLLRELMDLCHGQDVVLNLEIKGEGVADVLVPFLNQYLDQAVLISSFDLDQLRRYRQLDSHRDIGVLVEFVAGVKDSLKCFHELGAVSWNPSLEVLLDPSTTELIEELHVAGAKVYAFTLRKKGHLDLVLNSGCDGAFIDDPITVEAWLKMRSRDA